MFARTGHLILSLLLACAVIAPNIAGAAAHACQDQHGSAPAAAHNHHADALQTAPADSPASHNSDCHCPTHRTGCCHINFYLSRTTALISASSDSAAFSEYQAPVPPGPFMEGPFQPPRAS